jgi:hypothetical protein
MGAPDQWIGVWGLLTIGLVGTFTIRVLNLFIGLTGMPWIYCYFIGIGVAALGVLGLVSFSTPSLPCIGSDVSSHWEAAGEEA